MTLDQTARLLLALAVIVIWARVCGGLARRLGQPAVIGEIAGGVLLGPTLFSGDVTRALFPSAIEPALSTVANVGVCVFMFMVGLRLDHGLLRGQGRIASSRLVERDRAPVRPWRAARSYLAGHHVTGGRLPFVLFVGTAMAITAFPVLARILTDKELHRHADRRPRACLRGRRRRARLVIACRGGGARGRRRPSVAGRCSWCRSPLSC